MRTWSLVNTLSVDSRPSIVSFLGASNSFQASNLRDNIFFLLGLTTDADGYLAEYSLSTRGAFEKLAKFHIYKSKTLHILLGNRRGQLFLEGVMSWLPEPYGLARSNYATSPTWAYWYNYGSASGELPADVVFESVPNTL